MAEDCCNNIATVSGLVIGSKVFVGVDTVRSF
jgi:hypothetical protein